MLARFSVQNFKSFNEVFTLDLTQTKRFEFNENCVKDSIVNHGLIYGPNGIGKSNLAFAVFDIIQNLTDKQKRVEMYANYLNAESREEFATFRYEFAFDQNAVVYTYTKRSYEEILSEELVINGEIVVRSQRNGDQISNVEIALAGAENLKTDFSGARISIVKYIKNNTILAENPTNSVLDRFFKFVDSMLHFRSLDDRFYQGFELGTRDIFEDIINGNKISEFQQFLSRAEIDCDLGIIVNNGKKRLAFKFGEKLIDFWDNSSTGTHALALFYFWLQKMKRVESAPSLVFVDEFDAFYHQAISEVIVRELIELGFQTILTTHNTSLMSNDLLRPDCYFQMSKKSITPFSSMTEKDIRKAHNIEKMYKSGMFHS